MATREDGNEVSVVLLDYKQTVIVIDHEAHTQHAWSLDDSGEWVEANIVEALYNGRVIHDVKLSDLPPLPAESGLTPDGRPR